ncbi:telomerase RNA component interacting RNase [Chrysemys picta bellii]|uniref:Telomerase RNA component interacting RNase n=1 Tax=Chrysemys picta bellii TaxID=8478 RepID=A0A8C3IHW0_CHRPI|nr:telomerase RNA component interacting RNase [Chrysemys picta bellii]
MAARGGRAAAAAPQGPGGVNIFANDGSFLELFKRKMEAEQRGREAPAQAQGGQEAAAAGTVGPGEEPAAGAAPGDSGTEQQRPPEGKKRSGSALSFVGKRRGGNKLALKTGVVAKKQKTEEEVLTSKGDAWAKYMAEVKKYKAHQCSDDDKTRPLVK